MSVMYIRNEQTGEFEPVPSLVGPQGPPGSNGDGAGTVTSVNKVAPDATGNVTLTAADVGAASAADVSQLSDHKVGLEKESIAAKDCNPTRSKYIADDTGKLSSSSLYNTTDFIPIKKGLVYAATGTIRNVLQYDENQNPIAETFMQINPVGNLSGYSAVSDGFFRMTYNKDNEESTFITFSAITGNKTKIEEGVGLSEFNKKQVADIARSTLPNSVLFGKKWAVCGDSFTAGQTGQHTFDDGICAGERKIYPYFVRQRTCIDVLKFYASGRTLAYPADGTFSNSLTNPGKSDGYKQIPEDVDYVTIYLGINDSQHNEAEGRIPIGSIDDESTSTYYGAWNVVLSWLIENRPNAHIGIIVSNGVSKMEYRDAQIAIAEKYGIPYIDLNGDERTRAMIRPMNEHISDALKETLRLKWGFDPDGSRTGSVNNHPNEAAHEFESYAIEAFLRSI